MGLQAGRALAAGNVLDPRQQALDKATAAVRAARRAGAGRGRGHPARPGYGPGPARRPRRPGAGRADQQDHGGRVVRKAAGPDGTVDPEGTFIELRNSGGGGSYEDVAVLLCVRLSGKPGPQARVELADAPCPTNPTSRPPNFGSIDKIVTLS